MKVEESGQSESGQSHESPLSERELISEDFACDICDKSFGTENSLKAHRLRAHRKSANWSNEDKAAKGSPSENVGEEEISLDLKKETQTTNQAVALARSQQRLKALNPKSEFLHGGQQQPEGNSTSKTLADVELAQYIRSLRETTGHPNNNGDSSETALLKKEVTDLREALRQKDLQSLRDENAKINEELKEIRSEMRTLPNSGSDLAALVKSTENIIIKAVESEGPIRRYLTPDGITIQKPSDAPKLQTQIETRSGVLEELRRHNLVTRIVDVQKGGA